MNFKADEPSIVCAALGLLGAVVSLVIGFYLVSTMANLARFQDETTQIGMAIGATTAAATATIVGSYMILGSKTRRGGEINVLGGTILIITYIYFSELSRPKLLEWLNPLGLALLTPAILSGVISLMRNQKNLNAPMTTSQ